MIIALSWILESPVASFMLRNVWKGGRDKGEMRNTIPLALRCALNVYEMEHTPRRSLVINHTHRTIRLEAVSFCTSVLNAASREISKQVVYTTLQFTEICVACWDQVNIKRTAEENGKVKLSLCFNWAPRREGVLGEWSYNSTHSSTSALDGGEWSA